MRNNSSIVTRLITYFLLLNIVTVGVVSLYSYFRAKDALVERTFDQLTSVRIEKKFRIERFFNDLKIDLELLSASSDVEELVLTLGVPDFTLDQEGSDLLLKHVLSRKKYYFLNVNGTTAGMSIDSGTRELVISNVESEPINILWDQVLAKQVLCIEDNNLGANSDKPAIFIGAPVFEPDRSIIGMVAIEVDIEAINSIMFENNPLNGLGDSGESYLVGADHLMRSTSRFEDNSVFNTLVNTESVMNAFEGQTGTLKVVDYRGIDVLSSFSSVNILGEEWAILAEIDEKEAMIPIVSIRNNILYLSVLISLLSFALVYLIARRISLPIIRLQRAAQTITEGNYDVTVGDISSRDEIGSLEKTFNEMSRKIKEQTENLEIERSMRLSSMIDGQELERHRLSRELHDGLGQSILAIKMRLERTANASPEKVQEIMTEVQGLFANVIAEVRSISNDLMPAALNEFGLIDALSHLCREISKSSGMMVEFKHDGYSGQLKGRIRTYLYRIAQEVLNNSVKYARSDEAKVEIKTDSEYVFLCIMDHGVGFTYKPDQVFSGNGISNIRERVHLLNGEISIVSEKDKGTNVEIRIPLND